MKSNRGKRHKTRKVQIRLRNGSQGGYSHKDTISLKVVQVDLDVDSDYDGYIENDDDPIEVSAGGLVCLSDNLNTGLTSIKLSLTAGTPVGNDVRLFIDEDEGDGKIRIWNSAAKTTEVDLTQPFNLGTAGTPKYLYVEGIATSTVPRDVTLRLQYARADGSYLCEDMIKLTVVRTDVDVDSDYDGDVDNDDDSLEESAGGFAATNVLRRINLAVYPRLTTGGMILSAASGGDKIKVWADQNKTTEVPLDKAWSVASFPDRLYVEGIKASDTVRDVQLRLCYTNKIFSCRDEIKLTAIALVTETAVAIPVDTSRKKVGVGEVVSLRLFPIVNESITWTPPQLGVLTDISGRFATFIASDQAGTQTITATLNGTACSVSFVVLEPTNLTAVKIKEFEFLDGVFGVGMELTITVHPISVSFSEVEVLEYPSPAINITGYFENYPPGVLDHTPNTDWGKLNSHNAYFDKAKLIECPSPWRLGSYQWDIPVLWRVRGGNRERLLSNSNYLQTMTIHSVDGNSSVEKLGCSATRCP